MSWDVSIFKFAKRHVTVEAIPKDERPLVMGSRAEVHSRVSQAFPGTDWTDPSWGDWDSEAGSIEFNLGKEEPADGMMLHVRAGSAVVPRIISMCIANGWQALDCSSGEFLEKSINTTASIEQWQTFRDQIVRDSDA